MDNNVKDSGSPSVDSNHDLINEEIGKESSGSYDMKSQNAAMDGDGKSEQEKQSGENLMMLDETNNSILQSFGHSDNKSITDISDDTFACNLIKDLYLARKKGLFCDITLLIGPDKCKIEAHRVVLSSASDYFRIMFSTDFKESSQSEVDLPKTDFCTMESLITFMYTGKISVINENIEKVIEAANFFGMTKLVKQCVDVIKPEINVQNAIEILEFAEHISNEDLKAFAKKYFIENFDEISKKNLDIMDMSHNLLLEIIADDATAIDQDPTENEERLFQVGWNNLQSKSDYIWEAFVPKLMKAVHLSVASNVFLSDLARKIEDHREAKKLLEKAKFQKKAGLYSLCKMPNIVLIDDNVRWGMKRFQKTGRAFVICHGMINQTDLTGWYGSPIFVDGEPWVLFVSIETHTDDGPPVKYLAPYLCLEREVLTEALSCTFYFEIVPPKTSRILPYGNREMRHDMIDTNNKIWGVEKFIKLTDVFAKYYDKDTDSCKVVVHITEISKIMPIKLAK